MNHASGLLNVLVLVGVGAAIYLSPAKGPQVFSGQVTWVSDGDTFKVASHPWPVRVWGVDAPERDTKAGQDAREFLTERIKGQVVTCEKIVVDKYRRTVAKCWSGDVDIAVTLLNSGHAIEFCSFTRGAYGKC